jgi:pimeloyl-ACP methyl ester carboxylesterase
MPYVQIENSASLFYEEYGHGTPIVFIHAITLSHVNWQTQIRDLSDQYRVIVYDLRGHGKSTYHGNVTYANLANDIACLLDHLQCEQALICGYSNSASIAFDFLRQYPERTLGIISVGGYQSVQDWYMKLRVHGGLLLIRSGLFAYLRRSIARSNAATHQQYLLFLKEGGNTDPLVVKTILSEALQYDATSTLQKSDVPFLLVYGKKDKWMHKYAEQMKSTMKRAEVQFIDGIGHQIPTIKGDELNQLIHSFASKFQPL